MKGIINYINEKLYINTKNKSALNVKYIPSDRNEFHKIVDDKLNNSPDGHIDLRDVNMVRLTNLYDLFHSDNYRENIKSINMQGIDLSGAKTLLSMFQFLYNLKYINISDIILNPKITSINNLFAGCNNLEVVDGIDTINISSIESCQGLFYDCYNLIDIGDLSKWNTKNLENTEGMFEECTSLTDIGDISNWNTDRLLYTTRMFYKCKNLKNVGDLNKWNIRTNRKNMQYMFYGSKIPRPKWSI